MYLSTVVVNIIYFHLQRILQINYQTKWIMILVRLGCVLNVKIVNILVPRTVKHVVVWVFCIEYLKCILSKLSRSNTKQTRWISYCLFFKIIIRR